MDAHKAYRLSIRVYASIVLFGAVMHAAWYWFIPGYAEMRGLTLVQQSFLSLLNWSVSILLLFFAIMAFGISTKSFTVKQLRMFSLLMVVFWSLRFVLELVYPVQIPFVVIPNASLFIKVLLVMVVSILALPEVLIRFNDRERDS